LFSGVTSNSQDGCDCSLLSVLLVLMNPVSRTRMTMNVDQYTLQDSDSEHGGNDWNISLYPNGQWGAGNLQLSATALARFDS
jgi:hypothetical protein